MSGFFAERSRPFPTVERCFLIKTGDRKGRPYIILRNHHTSAENLYRIPQSPSVPAPFNKGAFLQKNERMISAPTVIMMIPAVNKSLPCAKGGGICEANDEGIVTPSHQIQPVISTESPRFWQSQNLPPLTRGAFLIEKSFCICYYKI